MSNMKHIILFLKFFYILVFTVCSITGECRTTIGRNGICRKISDCTYTRELRRIKGHYSKEYEHYLNENFCGFHGDYPKVCCPVVRIGKFNWEQIMHKKPSSTHFKKPSKQTVISSTNSETEEYDSEYLQSLLPYWCSSNYNKRVIGGETEQLNESPWLALLEYEESSRIILGCSGSLISKRYVLTAGHCVSSIPEHWQLKRVRLGEQNTQTEVDCEPEGDSGQKCADRVLVLPIERKIIHENFWEPRDYANDIALLRLSQDVQFTDYIQPICMSSSPDLGDIYWSAGWGQTEFRSQSSIKLKVTLPLFDFEECANLYATKNITLSDGQICAGGVPGKDTCAGDSGGPLVRSIRATWTLDGVVSMGHRPCGQEGWPAVYTKVFHYLPWVLRKLKP